MESNGARDLLRRCALLGDGQAWSEFRERFEARLVAGIRRGLRRTCMRYPPAEVEDLLQDVYCKLLDNGGRCLLLCHGAAEEAVSAYLGRIAESVAIDRVRAELAAKRGRGRVAGYPEEGWNGRLDTADCSIGPEQQLLLAERQRLFLRRCREVIGSRTPKRDLRVLYLACVEGWSSREIARTLGQSLTTSSIDSLVHRARKRLEARGIGVPARGRALRLTAGAANVPESRVASGP